MSRKLPFPGPSAPWVEDDDEHLYSLTLRRVARDLASRLQRRVDRLSSEDVSEDEVITELRKAISDCAVDGHVTEASEFADSIIDLIETRANQRRLL